MNDFKAGESREGSQATDRGANDLGDMLLGQYRNEVAEQRILDAQDAGGKGGFENQDFMQGLRELQDWCVGLAIASARGSDVAKDYAANAPMPALDTDVSGTGIDSVPGIADMLSKAGDLLGAIPDGIAAAWDQSITASVLRGVMDLLGDIYDSLLDFFGVANDLPHDFVPGDYERRVAEGLRAIFTPEVMENWDRMSAEQRHQYIGEYTDYISRVLGVSIKEIKVADLNPNHLGTMFCDGTMVLNSRFYDSTEHFYRPEVLINIITHEVRHMFQYSAMQKPELYGVPQETADLWLDNKNNYISGHDDPQGYWSQPIEADARSFAQQVMSQAGFAVPSKLI
jgi:hypothetical protein